MNTWPPLNVSGSHNHGYENHGYEKWSYDALAPQWPEREGSHMRLLLWDSAINPTGRWRGAVRGTGAGWRSAVRTTRPLIEHI
jgi:hypothetical protein